jgi:hypothetical protein
MIPESAIAPRIKVLCGVFQMNAASWSCIRFMQPNHQLNWSLDLYEINKWCAINTRRCQYTIYLYDFAVRNGQKRHLIGIWGSTVCDLTIGDLSHSHVTCFLAICLSKISTFQAGSLKNSERPSPVLTYTTLGETHRDVPRRKSLTTENKLQAAYRGVPHRRPQPHSSR